MTETLNTHAIFIHKPVYIPPYAKEMGNRLLDLKARLGKKPVLLITSEDLEQIGIQDTNGNNITTLKDPKINPDDSLVDIWETSFQWTYTNQFGWKLGRGFLTDGNNQQALLRVVQKALETVVNDRRVYIREDCKSFPDNFYPTLENETADLIEKLLISKKSYVSTMAERIKQIAKASLFLYLHTAEDTRGGITIPPPKKTDDKNIPLNEVKWVAEKRLTPKDGFIF